MLVLLKLQNEIGCFNISLLEETPESKDNEVHKKDTKAVNGKINYY